MLLDYRFCLGVFRWYFVHHLQVFLSMFKSSVMLRIAPTVSFARLTVVLRTSPSGSNAKNETQVSFFNAFSHPRDAGDLAEFGVTAVPAPPLFHHMADERHWEHEGFFVVSEDKTCTVTRVHDT